jgi:hypothetical protein
MRVAGSLVIHLIWTLIRLLRPGGTRAVVAESLLIKHQLLIINRSRQRALAWQPGNSTFKSPVCAKTQRATLS